jgi:Xaa-Pro dipeptidase
MTDLNTLYLEHVARLGRAYDAIFAAQGLDAILLHSGVARPRSIFDDQFWPLRPVPHFAHFLPLVEPDAVLVVTPGKRPKLVRLLRQDFWEQPPAPPAHALSAVDVVEVRSADAMRAALPAASARVAFVGEDEASAARLGHTLATSPSLLRAINETRVHKSAYDLVCLDEANRIAARGHLAVREAFLGGGAFSELDLHLLYLKETAQDDPETPYKNIFALGEHAATLHHVSYGRTRGAGATSLLVDAGVSYFGYASDITRTYVRGASAEVDAFGALLAGVERLQQKLCGEIALGQPYEALHDRAHVYVGEALREVGVVRGSVDEAVKSGVTRAFLPHGLGHSLGITCHDVGCAEIEPRAENPFLRNTRRIEAEQVFTIEPGIYFISALLGPVRADPRAALVDWKLVDTLAPFGGIRIEDDIRVRPSGATIDNLTRAHLP